MRTLVPLLVLAASVGWVRPASACSPIPAGWYVDPGLQPRTDVPIEGVVYLSAGWTEGSNGLAAATPGA